MAAVDQAEPEQVFEHGDQCFAKPHRRLHIGNAALAIEHDQQGTVSDIEPQCTIFDFLQSRASLAEHRVCVHRSPPVPARPPGACLPVFRDIRNPPPQQCHMGVKGGGAGASMPDRFLLAWWPVQFSLA
ncbi:hypothetical protein [Marilutibacter alkalisoli]|uniref:Uncharacterized protein n=1 Tax=Marilutibacter alkalisoli TaxID=2591633 RepID=A0A514BRG5_9GAMM|nr:hypothetical protein [Lysobacter alkalisoli]QDH69994.1 hypothetical protein FKV23_07715 [Lysobacter alkalisoli]